MAENAGEPTRPAEGGRKGGRWQPKGRQVDPLALGEVKALLAGQPLRRDLLIEHLHRLQDHHGCLDAAHLAALAELMRLPMAEVYEVATFYAHFDLVKEGEPAPPPVTLRVCDSLSCALAGSEALLAELRTRAGPSVRVLPAPCMGRCDGAPAVAVGCRPLDHATADAALALAAAGNLRPEAPSFVEFDAYRAGGGYRLLRDCLEGRRSRDSVIADVSASGLKGLGGAGFPAGRKWGFVRAGPAPRLLAVNADEGEPGTFKDRLFLETDPHRMLEGMLIAAWAVEAEAAYIYLRDEYPAARAILEREIPKLAAASLAPPGFVHLRRGAGAYICGEESAMLESIEGKRGLPRHRPPYAAEIGLFGRPTLIHNVETLHWLRAILENGPDWFRGQGRNGGAGLRAFSVSGRVKWPGVKIAPVGTTARELIEEHCSGMQEGHRFRAYLPGGASGGILPAALADLPLDFGKLEAHGCFAGSGAVIVLSDKDDLRATAGNLLRFFAHESCGQCTPCRAGTEKAVRLLAAERWDEPLLRDLARVMADASICGLGQAAPNPILSLLRFFRDEVMAEDG